LKGKKFFLSHQASIFQEHAVQRCQSRKPKGCGVKRSSFDSKRSGVLNQETGWVKIICISLFQQAVYIFTIPTISVKLPIKINIPLPSACGFLQIWFNIIYPFS